MGKTINFLLLSRQMSGKFFVKFKFVAIFAENDPTSVKQN